MTRAALVLGQRGMLGHVVARYLDEQGVRVERFDARFEAGHELEFAEAVAAVNVDAVVNCIGLARGPAPELLRVNGLLPQLLAARLGGRLLVQPSSDGVFSGAEGPSAVAKRPDATDPYGLSKRFGEACASLGPTLLIRTSIIGPELGAPRSLFGWLRAQQGSVRGFTDQLWNGVTTLCWAEACLRALRGETPPGLVQLGTPDAVTKHELLALLAEVFELDVGVEGQASGRPLDRRLVPTETAPPLREQLAALRRWYPL